MMDDLCEKKEEYMDQFFEECYQQKRMYPYLPEDFSVMVMDLSDSLLIVRVDLPVRDMGVPSCFRVYFAWNDETQEGRYFTIEQTQDPGKHLLGEFKKDWKHVDYGEAPAEGAELQRVLDIIRQAGRKLKRKKCVREINLAHFFFYGLARISAKVARTTRARS